LGLPVVRRLSARLAARGRAILSGRLPESGGACAEGSDVKTGNDLRAAREAKGWGLRELARRAGITHRAVAYWEARASLDPRGYAVKRMADALGITLPDAPPLGEFLEALRARGGVKPFAAPVPKAPIRVRCGARTRKGTPCRALSEPGKRRCRFHGGKSTGPRTPEGKARIAEAQRRRWARWRAEHGAGQGGTADEASAHKGRAAL
jgi:transcriptional regulator with XRE-family HTH domain